jgi:hypothetical protein
VLLAKADTVIDATRLEADFRLAFPGIPCRIGGMFSGGEGGSEMGQGIGTDLGFDATIAGITIRCPLMPMPAPGLDEMLQTSRIDREGIAAELPGHAAHLLCFAEVDAAKGAEATLQLFRLAVALAGQGAIGAIHVNAWQCFRMEILRKLTEPEQADQIVGELFPMVCCNIVPFHGQGGSWMTSKGFAVVGIPDITVWARSQAEMSEALELIPSLFAYIRGGARIAAGETLQMGGSRSYRVGPVTEFHEYLCGRGETLALRPIS